MISWYCQHCTIYMTAKDLYGKKFGYWIVVGKRLMKASGKRKIKCRCRCGIERTVCLHSLLYSKSTSCGCRKPKRLVGNQHPNYKGYKDFPGWYFNTIKNRAKSKNYECNVTAKYLWDLFSKQQGKCALSGQEIVFGGRSQRYKTMTASLDRIQHNKGYVKGNVQWVHKDLNMIKGKLDNKRFIELCRNVTENCRNQ